MQSGLILKTQSWEEEISDEAFPETDETSTGVLQAHLLALAGTDAPSIGTVRTEQGNCDLRRRDSVFHVQLRVKLATTCRQTYCSNVRLENSGRIA